MSMAKMATDLFRTDRGDHNINKATSYLDLGPLYGCDQREQDSVRTFQDGKLKPDSFAEKRVVGFPHGATVLLVMFNRYVCMSVILEACS